MMGIACLLFVLSTAVRFFFDTHYLTLIIIAGSKRIVVDIKHVYDGLILHQNAMDYFNDLCTDIMKFVIYEVQTLVGDGILVRCFVIYN